MKTGIAIVLLAASAVIYFLYFAPLVEPKAPRMKLRAKGEVNVLEIQLGILSATTNLLAVATNGELNNPELFSIFKNWNDNIINRPDASWSNQHSFTDPWGHDYVFLIQKTNDIAGKMIDIVRARSFGPNGVNEDGNGDDITGSGVELGPVK